MTKVTNRALATALAVTLVFGSGTFALADRGGNGHGQDKAKAKTHAVSVRDNDNDNDNGKGKGKNKHDEASKHHGYRASQSCINPAGNQRGWCKSHMNGSFITGRVTSINGRTALVTLSNGQQVTVNTAGRNLNIGQQITLRGTFGSNGVFVPTGGNYNNYGGPYSGASVRGLIVSVNGSSMQIVQGLNLITVDISNAASRGAISGTLIPGRTITANGNWSGSTFVATSIQ
ncbi:MAG TPA: hypothetical protein VFW34_09315 [Candidatus Rubrimentiphilum sp.]|nr:hypothetical protein [Candidatus Rubrimentiphilum sp.]